MNAPLKAPPGTSVAVAPGPTRSEVIREKREVAMLTNEGARNLIMPYLPKGVTFDRILSEVYLAVQKNPKLEQCTPDSMLTAVATCVKWDLTIGEEVYLVPFSVKVKVQVPDGRGGTREKEQWEDRAQAIRDYKGDIALVVRCGAARYVDAQNVYSNETFEYEQGTNPFIRHRPIMDPNTRGELIGSYAVAKISAHDVKIVVLSRQEIDQVRMQFSKQWKDHWVDGQKVPYKLEEILWYGPKTCVHRVTKQLPKSPKLAEVMAAFETEEAILEGKLEEIVPPVAIAASSAGVEARSQSPASMEASATHAPTDERADFDPFGEEVPEPPKRSALELYVMPFGKDIVGKPMGDIPSPTLGRARKWALQNNPGGLAEFIEKSALLLDERTHGDAKEPE